MKRKYWFITLALVIFMLAGIAYADKTAYLDAVAAHESGQKLNAEQMSLMREYNYNFNPPTVNELDEMGGPDLWGYYYMDSAEEGGPVYNWIDITETGTMIDNMGDDTYQGPFELGFDFVYYENVYTEVYICSNGFLMFGGGSGSLGNTTIPNTFDPNNIVCFFWDDLNPADVGSGPIYYGDDGEGNWVCTFDGVEEYGGNNGHVTCQTILYQNGEILMQYAALEFDIDINGETIGIENSDGTDGLQVSYNAVPVAYPYAELAILFWPEDAPEPDAWVTGTITDLDSGLPIEGAVVNVGGTEIVTGPDGTYMVDGLYSGMEYAVTVTAESYFPYADVITPVEGENILDVALEWYNTEGDILIWEGDETPGNVDEVEDILNGLGYTTFRTTDIEEVPWSAYGCVFAFCGIYPNYTGIYTGSIEETVMIDYLDAGGLLFVEGGDLFGYNEPANLMPYFNMATTSDGGSDLFNVTGVDGMWTEGFYMAYVGENNYIDHIEPGEGAFAVFTNEGALTPYTCGMVYDADTYMVACFSFEVGNLVDADNTREEVVDGVLDWFDYLAGPDLTIDLEPWNDPTWVGPNGGSFRWDVTITNLTEETIVYDAWTEVILPNQTVYGPLDLYTGLELEGGGVLAASPLTSVPGFAPNGIYTFFGKIGTYPDADAQDSFDFAKLPLPGPAAYEGDEWIGDWATSDWFEGDDAEFGASAVVPNEFAIEDVYPNPFNPTTNISISLPEASVLTVAIYNTLGQQVTLLANGRYEAGYHNLTFDAHNLSSGIYFVHANVSGKLDQTSKVILMR